jgi:hypothetical protein
VDGIDELSKESQATIVDIIYQATCSTEPIIKIFLSSRSEETYIRNSLEKYEHLELSASVIASDLRCYIEDSVDAKIKCREIKIRNPDLRNEIVTALIDGAKDM